jgi:hypothetical protein
MQAQVEAGEPTISKSFYIKSEILRAAKKKRAVFVVTPEVKDCA